VTQGSLVAQLLSWLYDRALFHGATLQDLPSDSEGPRFIICAANLTTGSLWRFSRPYMADWRVGRVLNPDFPLACAVAASSAYPPALSPMRLDLKRYELTQWPEPPDHAEIRPPLPAFVRSRAVLTDGGMYDNHGLEPVEAWPALLVSDGGAPHAVASSGYWNWYAQAKRVLEVEDNQVRALRRRRLIERFQDDRASGLGKGAYWSIGTNPDVYTRQGGLVCRAEAVTELAQVATRLADYGDVIRHALVNWGYAICDKSVRGWYRPDLPAAIAWPMPDGLDRVGIAQARRGMS
jgi:NTE family protein